GVNGKKYVDFTSGIGVNAFGLNDKKWKKAVIAQLNKVQHACNLYYTEPQVKLAELLCKATGAKKVFFGNSGAEANECAIKAARKYASQKYGEETRYEIVTLKDSFHGRTLATITATGQDAFHKYFGPFPKGFKYAEPNMKSIKKAVTSKTCAVMVELVQGESGVHVLDKEFVKNLEAYCKENDVLLIVDEVQTGNGRTGKRYAFEHYEITPDIVTTAKGLAAGLPIGACLFFEKTENAYSFGDHGTTFGGNPIACAAGVEVMGRLTEEFLNEVARKGEFLREEIKKMPFVEEVTGEGMMIGVKVSCTSTARSLAEKCLEKGLLILTAHDRLRLLPPLTITEKEIKQGLKLLKEVLNDETPA
ncbi:MAG: acetylornithine/succinylornithine family transaminase, partial [Clostridia bacterium]|nr:acetylornithine/succinylornithine family transaminase [Clostridia bacterium]